MKGSLGLSVIMKDKEYEVLKEESYDVCPIGGLISEYIRLPIVKLKNIILNVPHKDVHFLPGNVTSDMWGDTLEYFTKEIHSSFTYVQEQIVMAELLHSVYEMKRTGYDENVTEIKELNEKVETDEFYQKFVPVEALIKIESSHTVLDFYTEIYYGILKYYLLVGMLLMSVTRTYDKYGCYNPKDVDTSKDDIIYQFFEDGVGAQDIDYKIMLLDNELTPVYTLRSAMSLLLFDFAQVYKNNIGFVKCKNCGKYFVPIGRSDSKYCPFPLVEDPSKSCKDVGAQNARAEKEKNDVVTKSYRKVYMRYMVHMSRHPEDDEKRKKLDQLTEEVKVKRKELQEGNINEEQFLEWLNQF